MAEKIEVWKASDGTYWQSESQCLAYELKMYLINLGKSAATIQVDPTGKIDADGINVLAGMALSAMGNTVPASASSLAVEKGAVL